MSAAEKPLGKEQFERVSSLFNEALALRDDAVRVAFAKERAADDPAVLAQLLVMLDSHEREEQSAGFEARADGAVREETGQLDAELLEALPEAIGAFQIIRHIATGGMGTVYEAVQEDPHRRVALKVLRAALLGPESIERFEFEGQILARLRHPGIAQVYTMGRAEMSTGHIPYIVMEFVDGCPINQYVRDNKLQPRAILALLAKVCEAIRYAHRRGIIHRDIKPSNILVDSAGDPRVVDFGIARPFGDGEDDVAALTASGLYLGTLPYMSPEQAAGGGAPLDVRTDVYSLGAVGYELLAGHPPHDLRSKSLPDAFRILADRPAPSLETVDEKLGGDISVIIAKALATDASRRYSTVEAFGEDIRRFLDNKPIRARADSRAYQMRLFLRRNRVAVFVAAAGIVALIASLVLAIEGRNAAQAARRDAEKFVERNKRLLYASQIREALQAIEAGDGPRARDILEGIEAHRGGWERRYLEARLRQAIDVHRFRDGPSPPRLFAFSPDWRSVVLSDGGRGFRRIEVDTGELMSLPIVADAADVSHIRFSATGQFLALVHKNGALSVFSTMTWRMVRRIVDPPDARLHPTGPYDLFLWSPDPETPARRVVDLQRGTDVGQGVDQWLRGASQWLADTTGRLVVLDAGRRVQVVDLVDNTTLEMDEPQDADRQALAISAHGWFVASAGRSVRFWDVRNELLQWELASPRGDRAVAIAFNEHEDRAAIGYRSGLVRIVDVVDRRVLTSAMDVRAMPAQGGHDRGPLRIRFDTAFGEVACVGFEQVSRWVAPAEGKPGVPRVPNLPGELRRADALSESAQAPFRIAFHPRGRFLLTSGAVTGWRAVTVWDTWSETKADNRYSFHPWRGGDELPRELLARLARVSDPLPADLGFENAPSVLAGRFAFVGSRDGTIAMWDVEAHILIFTLLGHEGAVVDLAFDPIDGTLASVFEDGTVRLWHTMPVAARQARAREAAQRGDFLWEIVRRHQGRRGGRSEIAERIRADRRVSDTDRDAAVALCLRGY